MATPTWSLNVFASDAKKLTRKLKFEFRRVTVRRCLELKTWSLGFEQRVLFITCFLHKFELAKAGGELLQHSRGCSRGGHVAARRHYKCFSQSSLHPCRTYDLQLWPISWVGTMANPNQDQKIWNLWRTPTPYQKFSSLHITYLIF